MTRRAAPNRFDSLVDTDGLPSSLFAEVLENLIEDVNNLTALPINNQSIDYTWVLDDSVVRFTGSAPLTMTIPGNGSVEFEIGTIIEAQNDSSKALTVVIDTDILTFEADGTTGSRTIAAAGSGRFLKVEKTKWKCRGEQMT